MKFGLNIDPYNQGQDLFVRDSVIIHPGLTFVIGCNGSGKSAFLKTIEEFCTKAGTVNTMVFEPQLDVGESIGEATATSFSMFLEDVQKAVTAAEKNSQIVVLADLSQSGITADSIAQLENNITFHILPNAESKEVELFVLIAASDFEYFLDQECLDVQTFNRLRFNNYTSYKKYLVNSRAARDKRYKKIKKL